MRQPVKNNYWNDLSPYVPTGDRVESAAMFRATRIGEQSMERDFRPDRELVPRAGS